jgi:hypothetical protein
MRNELIDAAVDGFKDSFRLLAGIAAAIAITVIAFMNHEHRMEKEREITQHGKS